MAILLCEFGFSEE